jgi:predicted transposase YbfD/YdcC
MPFTSLFACTQDLTDAAKALLLLDVRPTSATLDAARTRLLEAMRRHTMTKDRILLATLRESDECAHQAMARRTAEQDLEWRQRTLDHFVAWPRRKVLADPHGHRAAAQRLLRLCERRAAHQEQLLLPMAEEALLQRPLAA